MACVLRSLSLEKNSLEIEVSIKAGIKAALLGIIRRRYIQQGKGTKQKLLL